MPVNYCMPSDFSLGFFYLFLVFLLVLSVYPVCFVSDIGSMRIQKTTTMVHMWIMFGDNNFPWSFPSLYPQVQNSSCSLAVVLLVNSDSEEIVYKMHYILSFVIYKVNTNNNNNNRIRVPSTSKNVFSSILWPVSTPSVLLSRTHLHFQIQISFLHTECNKIYLLNKPLRKFIS